MMIERLFLWFYCLPIPNMVLLSLLAAVCLLAVHDRLKRRWWWNALLALGLLAVAGGILLQTVLGRSPGNFQPPVTALFASYREVLRGGNRELLRSNLMNVMLFVPLGLLSAMLVWRWKARLAKLLLPLPFAAMSFGIEYAQYRFGLGLAEADDVLHNILGVLAGIGVFLLWPTLRAWAKDFWDRIE